MTTENIEVFKKAFFNVSSRAFGESYVQRMLYTILGDVKSDTKIFDAIRDKDGEKLYGEYKAVRVAFPNVDGDNMYEKILNFHSLGERIASIEDIKSGELVSNFQNIKLNNGIPDFNYLVYVLATNEGFYIFEISRDQMKQSIDDGSFTHWSDKHGSKESGKNGQFVICKENLEWHNQFLIKTLTWEEIAEICKTLK